MENTPASPENKGSGASSAKSISSSGNRESQSNSSKSLSSKSLSNNEHKIRKEAEGEEAQEEIGTWLKKIGLECYQSLFEKENIDLQSLPDLDDEHFKELGISVGHRIKLRKAISELQRIEFEAKQKIEYVCKVIVVGDIGTGKTSLIQRYTRGTFDKGYKATIGVDFCLKELKWNKNTTVSVQLWDIAGQERFANLTRMYYKEARGAFVVFDVTRDRTFEAVLKWKADIDSKVTLPNGKVIPVVLLANKCDMVDKDRELDLGEFCKEHGFVKWFLTSAKENIGINEAAEFLVHCMLDNEDIQVVSSVRDTKNIDVSKVTNQNNSSGCCN